MTTVPPQPKGAPSRGHGFGLVAIVVALLAVLIALGSSLLAWRASTKAGDAVDRIAALENARAAGAGPVATTAAPPADQPIAAPTTEAVPVPDPGDSSVPVLDAQTQYTVRYADKPLTIAPANCGHTVYLDLDAPQVQVDQTVAELRYDRPCSSDPANFRLEDGMDGAKVASEGVKPSACNDEIGSSPLLHDQSFPVHRGDVFCVRTSLDNARASGNTWKMVVFSVQATAQDGSVALKASAWDIPIR